MELLYFGPTASIGIFHSKIRKALTGLHGATNLHDNILVWGRNHEEHLENLANCLQHCPEKGITLKMSKSTFAMRSNGLADDLHPSRRHEYCHNYRSRLTTQHYILQSFLMACQYNAKFAFDHPAIKQSYEEITLPRRELLGKNARFQWGDRQEQAYIHLRSIMNSVFYP